MYTQEEYSKIFLTATLQAEKNLIDTALKMKNINVDVNKLTDQNLFDILLAAADQEDFKQFTKICKYTNSAVFTTFNFWSGEGRRYLYCYRLLFEFGKHYKSFFIKVEPQKSETDKEAT